MFTQAQSARKRPLAHGAPKPGPAAESAPKLTVVEAGAGAVLSGYQEQICELEQTVTRLRGRVRQLEDRLSELDESRSTLSELFQSTPGGYLKHDAVGRILLHNRFAAEFLGIKDLRCIHPLLHFVARRDVPAFLGHLDRCSRTRSCVRTQLHLRNSRGYEAPVELRTLPERTPPQRQPHCFYTIFTDISERRKAEQAMADAQERNRRLIDAVEGIVWEADVQTMQVTFVSQYAERLLGYALTEWRRPDFWRSHIFAEDRERVSCALARAVERRERLRIDYRVLTASRRVLWLHDSMMVAQRQGSLKLLGVAVDITDRQIAEEQLQEAQATLEERVRERTRDLRESVRDLEAFSYSLSHDLRSPLRSMLGFAELALTSGGELPPLVKSYLERIVAGGRRADQLIRDILTYSPLLRADLPVSRLDLEYLFERLIEQYPEFQAPRAHIKIQRPLLPVMAHEACLGQCLTNLLSNAVKFVRRGCVPRVNIWTEPRRDDCGNMRGEAPACADGPPAFVRIWIEDNGIGIEEADLRRIFNLLEKVHSPKQYEGTGIGLAIVRKGVERMGGKIGVESQPGKGSRFWLQLRAAK